MLLLIHRIGNWAEWSVAPMLLLTTVVLYLHQQYLTAVVVAACAGVVLGVRVAKVLFDRSVERQIEEAFDELFKLVGE